MKLVVHVGRWRSGKAWYLSIEGITTFWVECETFAAGSDSHPCSSFFQLSMKYQRHPPLSSGVHGWRSVTWTLLHFALCVARNIGLKSSSVGRSRQMWVRLSSQNHLTFSFVLWSMWWCRNISLSRSVGQTAGQMLSVCSLTHIIL